MQSRGLLVSVGVIAVITCIWGLYNASPITLLLVTSIYAIAVVIPGKVLLERILPNVSQVQAWVFGSIAAELALGILCKLLGGHIVAAIVLPLLAVVLWWRNRSVVVTSHSNFLPLLLIIGVVLAFLGLFLYGQAHLGSTSTYFSYNPTVDLTYFQTVLTSISNYGEFKDLAHLGYHFHYPDLGYQVLSQLHRLSGAEAFDVLFFFAPFKDFLLLSFAVFALLEGKATRWLAALAAISFYVFSSRGLLDLNVPITNPAYREGLYTLVFVLWAYQHEGNIRRWALLLLGMVGLVMLKPAIFLVAAPAFILAESIQAWRTKQSQPLIHLALVLAISSMVFYLFFSPGQSGLSGGHYSVIFGEGLSPTIDALSKINDSFRGLKQIAIGPLGDVGLGGMLLGLLLFIPFILQHLRHAGRFILLPILLWKREKLATLQLQLLSVVLACFSILAFVGMEYTSFLHVYLLPLALTSSTIFLALSYSDIQQSKIWTALLVLGLLYDISFAAYGYYSERTLKAHLDLPTQLIEDYRVVRTLTDTSSTLATYRTGLFQPADERSYLAAAFTERKILSEGAIYGSMIMGYQENVKTNRSSPVGDTLIARRATRDSIYFSLDPSVVRASAARYGISHIVIEHGSGERIVSPIGDTIFHGEMLTLLKL